MPDGGTARAGCEAWRSSRPAVGESPRSGPGPTYACLAARCADVPIYPTLPPQHIGYILRDSGAMAVVVSSVAQLEKILAIRHPDVTPALQHVIAIDPDATGRGGHLLRRRDRPGAGGLGRYPRWREEALEVHPTTSPR